MKLYIISDDFTNDLLRGDNFTTKYVPIRIQNMISECLNSVLKESQKKLLRDFEERKYVELRAVLF